METPLVSVVIPIYNVSVWIDRGMENILAQTLQDLEVWLVDDGSTDDSAARCERWTRRDRRVHLLRKENGGAGSARNAGIDAARGRYIYFFDIDDLAHAGLLEYATEKMESLAVDYLMFGFQMIDVDNGGTLVCGHKERIIHNNKELRDCFAEEMVLTTGGNGFPWNKMYRRSFLKDHGLRFENQRIQQDEVFNLLVYERLERAYISPAILYDYFVYNKGNTRMRFIPERFDIYVSVRDHFQHLLEVWGLEDERVTAFLHRRFMSGVSDALRFNLLHKACPWSEEERRGELERIMRHPYTLAAITSGAGSETLEGRCFLYAFRRRDLRLIRLLNGWFAGLRRMKRRLKRLR